MALIQSPSIVRKLMRSLRLTSLPDGVLAPETVPVIIVEDLSDPLSDVSRSCGGAVNRAAVAGEQSHIGLIKTSDDYDLIVTDIFLSGTANQSLEIGLPLENLLGLTTSGESAFLDRDTPGRPSTIIGSDTAAALPSHTAIWRGIVLGNTIYHLKVKIRLGGDLPGRRSIMILANSTNTILEGGFWWSESDPEG